MYCLQQSPTDFMRHVHLILQEIFEIGHNGSQCVAESLVYHQTGEFSCMNASASRYDPIKQRTIIGKETTIPFVPKIPVLCRCLFSPITYK